MILDPDTVSGFTPSPDCIRDEIDIIAANVFGAVWRFSKGQRGQCDATLAKISKRAGYGTTATRMRLRLLTEHGWIVEERREGRPTVYRDSGRWVLKVVGEDTEPPTPAVAPKRKPQREALPSGNDPNARRCPPQRETLDTPTPDVAPPQREALAEDSLLKKDFKKDLKIEDVVPDAPELAPAIVPETTSGTTAPGPGEDPDDEPDPKPSARRPRPAPKPIPEKKPGPFQDVFRAICRVRRTSADVLNDEDRYNTRGLASTLCHHGVEDAATVESWGVAWYTDMATRRRCKKSEVSPPGIAQLKSWFGSCIAKRDGEVLEIADTPQGGKKWLTN